MAGQKSIGLAELRVGLLVLASIGVLILLILAVSGDISFFKKKMMLRTELVGAEGLKKGDEVRLAGVPIGSVEAVEFGPIPQDQNAKSVVVVRMNVDGKMASERIRTDSRVILRQVGLLGGEFLDISPGTLEGGAPVKDGDLILGKQETTIANVVASSDDLLTGFKQLSNNLNAITEKINSNDGTIGRFVNDETLYININRATLEAQDLIRKIHSGQGTAGQLINNPALYNQLTDTVTSLQKISDEIYKGNGTAGKLIRDDEVYNNINAATAKLNATADRVDKIAAQIESGKGAIGGFIYDEKLHEDTAAAVTSLRGLTERLDRGEGSAGKFLHDDQLYNNLNQLSAESVKLLYDFRQNPKKYLSIKVSLF